MGAILLAVGSCGDALELRPLTAALRAAGAPFTLAFCGGDGDRAGIDALGLTGEWRRCIVADDAAPAAANASAAAFAAELLREPWSALATIGHGPFAVALGSAALAERVPVWRLEAGVRTFAAADPFEPSRRLADHAADHWCVAADDHRQQLLREGAPGAHVHVAGSLLPEALAALAAPANTANAAAGAVWVAFERLDTIADGERLQRWLGELAAAAAPHAVHVAPTGALQFAAPALPPGVELVRAAGASDQLAAALAARAIVTDSVGWQRLALARGIPCVALARAGALAETIATGRAFAAGDAPGQLQQAVARAIALPPAAPPAPPAASARVVALLTAAAPTPTTSDAAPVAAAPTTAVVLPSDGDASGRTLGEDEVALAAATIRRGTLNSTRGTMVTTFERRFAQWLGSKHAIACASGSAAVHVAIAALQLQPGDEVITTPITDMGALTPILYEGAVPVFADVDPDTLNVTAATVRAVLTERTRAIVVTHLFGLPCDLDGLAALARERGIALIEDAAQAFGATWRGRKVGTFGALAAFSLQQGKHITTGEGGIVATDDDALARRVFLFVNKAWGYGDKQPDHYFPALNYRLTELQGAVAVAQLPKLDGVVAARRAVAGALREALGGVPGLRLPDDPAHGAHSFWKFAFQVDANVVPGGALALGRRMQAAGVACVPRYIQKPAFECELFRDWRRSPVTWLPLQHNPRRERPAAPFDRGDYPGAVAGLEQVVVLPINERYLPHHVEHVAGAIRAAVGALQHG